eukprot:11491508-Alexandrium_andersonii.AAC.1
MSASLVGSEMCIRDRPRGGGVRHGLSRVGGHKRCVMWFCAWTWVRRAVSYTHLTLPTICSV